jgi:hypothetical protein
MPDAMAYYMSDAHAVGMPEILYYQHEKKELHPGLQARKSCRLMVDIFWAATLHNIRPKRDRHVKPHKHRLSIQNRFRHEQSGQLTLSQ